MKPESKFSRSFLWLNVAQFLGALNDNVFKLLAIFFLIDLEGPRGVERADTISAIAGVIFAVPFILFSQLGGVLADRFAKSHVLQVTKAAEVLIVAFGAWAFHLGHAGLAYVALFGLATQAALFGPSKYSVIPELVRREELSRANGWLIAITFLAVVLGSALGPTMEQTLKGNAARASLVCVGLAILGTGASLLIGRTPTGLPRLRPSPLFFRDAWRTLQEIRGDRFLLLAVFAGAYFNFAGAYMQINLIPFGMEHVINPWRAGSMLNKAEAGYLFIASALGMGVGALLVGRLSGRNIEFGLLPVGAAGLSLCGLLLWFAKAHLAPVVALVVLAGVCSAFFIVPLEAFVQWRSPHAKLGEIVAANALLNCTGWLVAALLLFGLNTLLRLSPDQCFVVLGVLTLALTVATVALLPDFLARFAVLVLTRTIYRVRVVGLEHVPAEGGALLVSNHVTLMDPCHLAATQQRRIRFLMYREYYERHPLRWLFRLMRVIPISESDPPRRIVEALQAARKALDEGWLVCIFAEGALTRTGAVHGFKAGLERIVRGTRHPIVPVYLGGGWGSRFSRYAGRAGRPSPLRWPYPLTVLFGAPLPPTADAFAVRQAVLELSAAWFEDRKRGPRSLGRAFVCQARRSWSKLALTDTTGRRMTYGEALIAALAIARRLRRRVPGHGPVGLLLPTSAGGALVNIALTLLRRPAVNLNVTASAEAFRHAIERAGLTTILTRQAFLDKMPAFANLPGLRRTEDLLGGITKAEKLLAFLRAAFWPASWLAGSRRASPDDIACIVFSSGSTGEPKGIMLTHHNLLSNAEALAMVFCPRPDEALCAALPLFHSFGYTCGIWFPLLAGIRAAYHSNPLDAAKVAEVVREQRCTTIFATPTFLLAYLRRAQPEDFRTLRRVIAGAEKLKPRLADAFEEKFGVRPVEGYGATELSPVAALNLPHAEFDGVRQLGHREGTVGRPLPGVAVRVVDPDTGAVLGCGDTGLLLVKGPNVMAGYLGDPERTAAVLRDGWYATGDVARIDEEGFVAITDRLARFSKIGGEMVPHVTLEDELLKGLQTSEAVVAVTSAPDEKKGERLVVLYTDGAGPPEQLQAILSASPLPNLWKPARDSYLRVDALPLTGTGKLDVKALRRMAEQALGQAPDA